MPIETECKIRVDDFATIEARLQGLGAEPHGEFVQDDVFFDTQDHRLLQADQGLRLRSLWRHGGTEGAHEYVLTYKGARQPGQLKRREEIEVVVAGLEAMVEMMARLGFAVMLQLQKRRRHYRLQDCWVELDTVPLLGRFVEIEGPGQEEIARVAGELGLDLSRSLTDSYAALLMGEARRRGLPTSPARFLLTEGG